MVTSLMNGVEDKMEVETTRPKWRDDPAESFSDWKIEIVVEEGDSKYSQIYHVHKTFLAHGPRRCEYFTKLLRSEEVFKENHSGISQITLDPLSAKALDYVYGFNHSITTETATALDYLGDYFGNSELQTFSIQFGYKDMSLDNVHVYYAHAEELCNEVICPPCAHLKQFFAFGLTNS
jgi:hypothetical protein